MKKELLTIESACDGLALSTAVFVPEEDVKGVFQISHGMAEHKERYFPFMEYLASQGYASVIHDHRGHGASVRSPEDLGYFYDESGRYIVEDIHRIREYIGERFPEQPVYLFGHSMGSMVVRAYIKKYDGEIDGLIVCGSPSRNPLVGAALFMVAAQKAVRGDRYRSGLIQNLAFGSYTKKIVNPVSKTAWLSANEENVKEYDRDKACGFVFTLNGFKNLFTLMRDIYKPSGWAVNKRDLPVLFIAGSEDPVIISEEQWNRSREFLNKVGYTNVKGKLYTGMRHEILNEDIREKVYDDVVKFVRGMLLTD